MNRFLHQIAQAMLIRPDEADAQSSLLISFPYLPPRKLKPPIHEIF